MKRIIILAVSVLFALSAAACAKKNTVPEPTAEELYGMSGTEYDTGVFTAFCPDGWTYVPEYDLTAANTENVLDDVIRFDKNTAEESNTPYIYIHYVPVKEEIKMPDSSYYNNVERVNPLSTGSYTWSGYSASVDGHKFIYITTAAEDAQYEVWFWVQNEESGVSLNDADVQAILSSLALTEEE